MANAGFVQRQLFGTNKNWATTSAPETVLDSPPKSVRCSKALYQVRFIFYNQAQGRARLLPPRH